MQLPALTGLRAIAALHVFLLHASLAFPMFDNSVVEGIVRSGSVGVTVFFVLSGFILGISQLRPGQGLMRPPREFWAARARRILPNYYAAVFAALPLWLLWGNTPASDPTPLQLLGIILASLTLTQTWVPWMVFEGHGQAWSLNVEAVFYLAFPLLAAWTAPLKPWAILGVLIATAACICVIAALSSGIYAAYVPFITAYANPLLRMPEFIFGLLIARLYALQPVQAPIWGSMSLLAWASILSTKKLTFR